MKAIINGRILLPDSEMRGQALLFDQSVVGFADEKAAGRCADELIDAHGLYVSPGLIDTHIHGYTGADFTDDDDDAIPSGARGLTANGVTAFLVTTGAEPVDRLEKTFGRVRRLMEESKDPDFEGAEIVGVHAEGPFINPERKGAMDEKSIIPFDLDFVRRWRDVIRVMTIAPEMPGGDAFIRAVREETDVLLSMGHTNMTFEQGLAAVRGGVTRATHLFNAMSPLRHREPGAVGAALASDIYTELIADTYHVHPGLYPMLYAIKRDKLVIVTDTGRYVGMPEGEYIWQGEKTIVDSHLCRLADGTIAGSVLKLNEGVRNLRDHAAIPLYSAVRAASLSAAESAGIGSRKGSLEPGKDADIILMDENCRVEMTIIRGKCKYRGK